ncbi:ROK family transcriptional regulator, partial [Streptomyces tunisiensis]
VLEARARRTGEECGVVRLVSGEERVAEGAAQLVLAPVFGQDG